MSLPIKIGAATALVTALGVAALTIHLPDLTAVSTWTRHLGATAPLVFAVIYAVAVPMPVPKNVLTAAAGAAFGVPLGVAVVLVGATAGAGISFGLGRALGRDIVARLADQHLDRIDAAVDRHGAIAALALRLIPVLPFTVLNYACGVTAMKWRHYLLGTATGMLPGTAALVCLGSWGAHLPPLLLISISVCLGSLSLFTVFLRHRRGVADNQARIIEDRPSTPSSAPRIIIEDHRC